ncbi:MAG: cell division protein SepF [Acidimicrobiales bacterium]
MASGIVRRAMVYLGLTDDDYDDYEPYDEPAPQHPQRRYPPEVAEQPPPTTVSAVRPIREVSSDQGNGSSFLPRASAVRPIASPPQTVKVHVVAPEQFADAQEIGDRYRNGQPVIVNLQNTDRDLSRRMIDFCSGVTYALSGGMDKVADQVFLLTPTNVEVSAEERRRLQERGLYRP